ncbi:MAG: trimethylamine methyltransferase family protein, partial [Candidatus Latescibacteria bacterium]|nr:trimethylamine methyltransferase family protein [Candidatus Latescibacterota bacterium]
MRISGCTRVLDDEEIQSIHEASVRFLEEVGIGVEHDRMLDDMAQAGYAVDRSEGRVTFPSELIDGMVERTRESGRKDALPPTLVCHAGGSPGFYFDPHTETVVDHTTQTLADAIRLVDAVPEVDWMNIMGFATNVPPMLQLFFHKMITWSCTEKWCSANEINDAEMFPYYRELCETYCGAMD